MSNQNFKFIEEHAIRSHLEKKGLVVSDEMLSEISEGLDEVLKLKIKQERNKNRVAKNDEKKENVLAKDFLTKEQITLLPQWVQDDLDEAIIIGSSKQVIKTSSGKKYHLRNPLNDLSGAEWTFYLNSVINTRYPTSGPEGFAHQIRKIHPTPKPPQLMKEIIEFFTKENDLVFDYFMGVGGTLLGASLANRRAIGVDLSDEYIDAYKEASNFLGLKKQKTIKANSIKLLTDKTRMKKILKGEEISLIAIDPPYGDMMSKRKTGEAIKKGTDSSPTPFTDSDVDLGNLPIEHFYDVFKNSVREALVYLKHKGHVVVFVKDLQPEKEKTNLLHARIIEDLNEIDGLQYLGTKIWADHSVNLYPYGYPYAYVSNQIHQYIMTFRKES